jgi:RHS repeat-associated protein
VPLETPCIFVYGPGGVAVEQINNTTGTVDYLHHDQQGSTRLTTGSTGKVEDTGLIYMRAREYDPSTGQFLSVDPAVAVTEEPYSYAEDDPTQECTPCA